MQTIIITGGRTLQGTVCPESAKNSVLPLMAAALLCRGRVTLHSVPRLADVETSIAMVVPVAGAMISISARCLGPSGSTCCKVVSGSCPVSWQRLLRRAAAVPKRVSCTAAL